jgi:hypothetical protein
MTSEAEKLAKSRYYQNASAQMGLIAEPPLREGEMLQVCNGKICRQNEQGVWCAYGPANLRPLPPILL